MSHQHNFDEAKWPLNTPINTASFTTRFVIDGSKPILEVYHEDDGDWQFLCGTTVATADLKIVCMGCMLDRDPSLGDVASLPLGWRAFRNSPEHDWQVEVSPDEED